MAGSKKTTHSSSTSRNFDAFIFRIDCVKRRHMVANTATDVKIFRSISDLSLLPFRKAPHFYEKSASFLVEKRLISMRKETLFFLALF